MKSVKSAENADRRQMIGSIVRPHRGRVVAIAAAAFGGGSVEAAFLVLVTRMAIAVTDDAGSIDLGDRWTLSLGGALAVAVGLVALRLALALAGSSWSTNLSASVRSSMQTRLAEAYLRSSWSMQQAQPSGHLAQLMTSFTQQGAESVTALGVVITASVSLTALVLGALLVDALATMIIAVVLVVLALVLAPIRQRIRQRARDAAAAQLDAARAVTELGALGLEMQTYGARDHFAQRIEALGEREVEARRRAQFVRSALPVVYTSLAYGALLAGLGVALAAGSARIPSLAAILLVMLRSLSYGQQLQQGWGTLSVSLPYVGRFDETVEEYEAAPASGGSEMPLGAGRIDLDDVGFSYLPDRPVLSGVSLSIEPGEMVGVLGPSGAGKSSLVQLLLGVRDVSEGSLQVGGCDLRDVDRAWWSQRVALVAQDALLFTGTVAENIRFFRDWIEVDDVHRAAAMAHVLADVEALPAGFDTDLGERGAQLSGGQRQRLSIARALAGRPEILILDEPTSALDVHSEMLVRETLAELRGETTVVVIAHRLSTLEICDRLFVIEGGRLVAEGSPGDLRTGNAFYRRALELSGMS